MSLKTSEAEREEDDRRDRATIADIVAELRAKLEAERAERIRWEKRVKMLEWRINVACSGLRGTFDDPIMADAEDALIKASSVEALTLALHREYDSKDAFLAEIERLKSDPPIVEMVHARLAGLTGVRRETIEEQADEVASAFEALRSGLKTAVTMGDALRAKLDEREHAAAMACETPDPKCDCSGCSLARDEDSRLSPPSAPAQDAPIDRHPEGFCACGRRTSECDRSRKACASSEAL